MTDKKPEPRTPSMDDKHISSPPVRTTEQYDADKSAGINRIGNSKGRDT